MGPVSPGAVESLEEIVKGQVVIARYDQVRARQSIKKPFGLVKLANPGALGQIATDDDKIRDSLLKTFQQAVDHRCNFPPKMQIGKVSKSRHGSLLTD